MSILSESVSLSSEHSLIEQVQQLRDTQRFQEAEELITRGREVFPNSQAIAEHWATAAHLLSRFDECVERLTIVTQQFPQFLTLHQRLFEILCWMGRHADADRVLAVLDRLSEGTSISLAAKLRLAQAKGNLEEAASAAAELRMRFPTELLGYTMGGTILRMLGRLKESADTLGSGLISVGAVPQLQLELALTATAAGEWQLAFDRLTELLRSHPGMENAKTALGDALVLWRLAMVEDDPNAIAVVLPTDFAHSALTASTVHMSDANKPTPGELTMRFESLGSNCEFGLVQRNFGAEPLSLLRWSNLTPTSLCAMLETRFDDVGNPENSFVQMHGDEYLTGDSRYFSMHSFMRVGQFTQDEAFAKSVMRMRYLKNKLLEDLDNGEKTFVYKTGGEPLTPEEIARIFSCFQLHYPRAAVLLVHAATEPAEIGTVRMRGAGLFEGYLDRINGPNWLVSHNIWLSICRKVDSLRDRRTA